MNTRVLFPDLNGCPRGKLIIGEHFDVNNPKTFRVSRSVLAQDIEGGEVAALPEFHPSSGDVDLVGVLDPKTYQKAPAQDNLHQIIADVQNDDGSPLEAAPRYVLKKAIDRMNGLGYQGFCASELEFYITNQDTTPLTDPALTGVAADISPYVVLQKVIQDMVDATTASGLDPEGIYTEGGVGQVEINFAPSDPLNMCDRTLYFKQAMHETAQLHGYMANFMAKPYADMSGSGFHAHMSLQKDGQNVFATDETLFEQAIAGIVAYCPDAFALFAPHTNSYRRHILAAGYVPEGFTWGEEGRQFAVRITRTGADRHIEFRVAGADVNQYLLFAYLLFAMSEGISRGLGYEHEKVQQAKHTAFPTTLDYALDTLESSEFMKSTFGEQFIKAFSAVKRQELVKQAAQISDWELRTLGSQI